MRYCSLFFFVFFGISTLIKAQNCIFKVKVSDNNGIAIEGVNAAIIGKTKGTSSDKKGYLTLNLPENETIKIGFSHISYEFKIVEINCKSINDTETFPLVLMQKAKEIKTFEVKDKSDRLVGMQKIDPKTINNLPSTIGGVEGIIKTLPGVVSNNELSSQYSVRGGNYDENLVYVNDIEIYRPFLVRAGEQEGLSFINADMVSSIKFSAGGFEAKYGDKMSSVLDIKYKKPDGFAGNFSASLLGGSLYFQNASNDLRFTYQIGVRYRQNAYLLNSLNTQGEYRPSFTDVQTFITYDITDKLELNFLGNFSDNRYQIIPQNRETEFGHVNEALKLSVFFDGKELMQYNTWMSAFSLNYSFNNTFTVKWINSAFQTIESEKFDVIGQYRLDELEKDLSKDNFGGVAFNRGIGAYINHARNRLKATVISSELKAFKQHANFTSQFGIRLQGELIQDRLSEWSMQDSSGYNISPQPSTAIILNDVLKSNIEMQSVRLQAFYQLGFSFGDSLQYQLSAGVRANYWELNNQLLLSPRIQFSYLPLWSNKWVFRASTGLYYQPPFYRELRDLTGRINTNIKAQQSLHFIAGGDYSFKFKGSPFKLTTEFYYKQLNQLIPYFIDNVRIRYLGDNNSNGFATGIDLKLNGDFVPGIDSWVSLSIMQTKENLTNDFFYRYFNSDGNLIIPGFTFNNQAVDSILFEPGFIPRLTDQRFTVGFMFQDYLKRIPDLKVNLGIYYGSGLPFGPPTPERYQQIFRIRAYRRVDIGFSYHILKPERKRKPNFIAKHVHNLHASAEFFNLLGISNTLNYLWIEDASSRQYAVPNYLTQRLINVKISVDF